MKTGSALAEVLVALAIAGLLLAGMVRVGAAGLYGGQRVNRALAARRGVDWALARLAEDLELAGHLLDLPGRVPPETPGQPGWPGGWRLIPGGLVPDGLVPGGEDPGGPDPGGEDPGGPDPGGPGPGEPVPAGPGPGLPEPVGTGPAGPGGAAAAWAELAFVCDRPLAPARLAEALPEGPGPAVVAMGSRRPLGLRAGDLVLVPGERLGWAVVAADADLAPGPAVPVTLEPGVMPSGCPAGTAVEALRPARLVRYAVVPLGPGNRPDPGGEPCLVRFELPCPPAGREPRWTAGWGRGSGIRRDVLVRRVARFRAAFAPARDGRPGAFLVDLTVTGPAPGDRAAASLRLALRNGAR